MFLKTLTAYTFIAINKVTCRSISRSREFQNFSKLKGQYPHKELTDFLELTFFAAQQDKDIETRFGSAGISTGLQTLRSGSCMRPRGFQGTSELHMKQARNLTGCLKYGVKPELLGIVAIRGVGRVRACWLYDAGYATPESLADAGEQKRIGKIIGPKVTRNTIKEIESEQMLGN